MGYDALVAYKRIAKRQQRAQGVAAMGIGLAAVGGGGMGIFFLASADVVMPKVLLACLIIAVVGAVGFFGGLGRWALTYLV